MAFGLLILLLEQMNKKLLGFLTQLVCHNQAIPTLVSTSVPSTSIRIYATTSSDCGMYRTLCHAKTFGSIEATCKLEVLLVELELGVGFPREILRELAQLLCQHRSTTIEHSCNIKDRSKMSVLIQKLKYEEVMHYCMMK